MHRLVQDMNRPFPVSSMCKDGLETFGHTNRHHDNSDHNTTGLAMKCYEKKLHLVEDATHTNIVPIGKVHKVLLIMTTAQSGTIVLRMPTA